MDIFDLEEWKPLADIIKDSRVIIRDIMTKHFDETIHDDNRKIQEVGFFLEVFRFITKKWNIEILYELEIHDGLNFNEIMRHMTKISTRTLSDCLKQLQNYGLITRNVQDTRPPTVLYKLSENGKGFIELSLLLIYYLANVRQKKSLPK